MRYMCAEHIRAGVGEYEQECIECSLRKQIEFERDRGAREFAEKLKAHLTKAYGLSFVNGDIDELLASEKSERVWFDLHCKCPDSPHTRFKVESRAVENGVLLTQCGKCGCQMEYRRIP